MRLDRFDNHQTGFGPCLATMIALAGFGAIVGGVVARLAELLR